MSVFSWLGMPSIKFNVEISYCCLGLKICMRSMEITNDFVDVAANDSDATSWAQNVKYFEPEALRCCCDYQPISAGFVMVEPVSYLFVENDHD